MTDVIVAIVTALGAVAAAWITAAAPIMARASDLEARVAKIEGESP